MVDCVFEVRGRLQSLPEVRDECPLSLQSLVVTLRCSDGKLQQLPAQAAWLSVRLGSILEHGGAEEEIPVPFDSDIMTKVVEYLIRHYQSEEALGVHSPLTGDSLADCGVSKWDVAFVNVERDTIFDLNLAANVFGIQSLFFLTSAKLAMMLKDKSPEKIKKDFMVQNDMPGGEEASLQESLAGLFQRRRVPVFDVFGKTAAEEDIAVSMPPDMLVKNSAYVKAALDAAERSGVLEVERTAMGTCVVSITSWRHAMWRTAALIDWRVLADAPADVRGDKDLILGVLMASNGKALRYASADLLKDRELILEAVQFRGAAFQEAAHTLRDDPEFVLACLRVNGAAMAGASVRLRKDHGFLLRAAESGCGSAFQGADSSVQEDSEFMVEAAAKDPVAFRWASKALHTNRDFALAAAAKNGLTLEHMSPSFKADHEIVATAVAQNPAAAVHAHVSRRIELGLEMPWDSQVSLLKDVSQPPSRYAGPLATTVYKPPEEFLFHSFAFKVNKVIQYSAGSTIGANMGQANYIASNSLLDKILVYERPEIDSVSNMWGSVANIGMRWKAFASQDINLLTNPESAVTIEQSRQVIYCVMCTMDVCEWVYMQPMAKEGQAWYLNTTAGVVCGFPGGGWRPGAGETQAPPKPDAERKEPPKKAAPKDSKPQGRAGPLSGWPGLAGGPPEVLAFVEGASVALTGVRSKTGATGTLVKRLGNGKWKVHLDSGKGHALLKEEYLQLQAPVAPVAATEVEKREEPAATDVPTEYPPASPPPSWSCSIVGTWNAWVPHEMCWDGEKRCFRGGVRIGACGVESFQILRGGSWDTVLHASKRTDGLAGSPYEVLGPSPKSQSLGKFWTIGNHQSDKGRCGDHYEVRLHLADDGEAAEKVEWSRCTGESKEADGDRNKRDVTGQWHRTGDGWQTAEQLEEAAGKVYTEFWKSTTYRDLKANLPRREEPVGLVN